jgi:ribulose-5-phosphate 4-epimerase/fuculose-1-phosphate aldolase
MALPSVLPLRSRLREEVSAEEWQLRVDLAAAYRIVAHYGWDDQLATHISVRLPGSERRFLLNPFGLFFAEITASSLVKVDVNGNVIDPVDATVNKAGFTIHSAIHEGREDAHCVLHLHTVPGVAVSCQEDGLQPLSPYGMILHGRVGYHDFEGVSVVPGEKPRLVEHLGQGVALILRNHGTLTVGASIPQAFHHAYMLERACATQIAAQSGNNKLTLPTEETFGLTQEQVKGFGRSADISWQAILRKLDRLDPSYKD